MNIDRFTQLLERAFKRTASEQVQDTQVRALRKWRPLAPLLDKALEGEDELDGVRGHVRGVAGERPRTPRDSTDSCVRC